MLLQATIVVALVGMAITLWMAFYLFARGFPNPLTLRMVVVLLGLSAFFFAAYINIFEQISGSASLRAVLLVIVLASWYSITFRVMSEPNQVRFRWIEWGMYGLALASIFVLLQPNAFIGEQGNALYVAHMNPGGWAYRIYGGYQFVVSFGIMLNLLVGDRVGLTSRGKYFLVASVFPAASILYGVASLGSPNPAPRLIQDSLAFCGVFILGLSVARHQTWTERRAPLEDFPLTTLSTLGLTAITVFIAWRRGMRVEDLAEVAAFVILAVGAYDLTREFLERLRIRNEGKFRKRLRHLEHESASKDALKLRLQEGLDLLCATLNAPSGFVAVRQGDHFTVMANRASVPPGSEIDAALLACEDVSQPPADQLSYLAWIAPSFEGPKQVAVVGIGKSKTKMEYSSGDLDLLAEVADQVGTLVSLSERHSGQNEWSSAAGEMIQSIGANSDPEFMKIVEEALRHLSDVITLGQSALADRMKIDGGTHIERGKKLQQILTNSIESLRPAEKRPPEPLPRVWYNHAVLHDAYVEGVQNREIMARLYISEGTFNRTRRNAIRGLARALIEMERSG